MSRVIIVFLNYRIYNIISILLVRTFLKNLGSRTMDDMASVIYYYCFIFRHIRVKRRCIQLEPKGIPGTGSSFIGFGYVRPIVVDEGGVRRRGGPMLRIFFDKD